MKTGSDKKAPKREGEKRGVRPDAADGERLKAKRFTTNLLCMLCTYNIPR